MKASKLKIFSLTKCILDKIFVKDNNSENTESDQYPAN